MWHVSHRLSFPSLLALTLCLHARYAIYSVSATTCGEQGGSQWAEHQQCNLADGAGCNAALEPARSPARIHIAVVIPLYNQGDLLPETLASVVEQTYSDWEVLIVNDGSTDDTSAAVAEQLVRKHTALGLNVSVLHKPNGGLAEARNYAIRAVDAEWILPLDADDIIAPTFLEKAVTLLSNNPSANLAIADEKGFGEVTDFAWDLPAFDSEELLWTNQFHCSAVFHRSLWEAVPFGYPAFTLFGYEDWAFWIAAHQQLGIRPVYIHEELFHYRIRKQSMLQQLLQRQQYSLASLRMLFPDLYPVDVLLDTHRRLLAPVPDPVAAAIEDKVAKASGWAQPWLMRGLVNEGAGRIQEALSDYYRAVELADCNDWQPKWRLALLQQRLGNYPAGNATLQELVRDFTTLDEVYEMRSW